MRASAPHVSSSGSGAGDGGSDPAGHAVAHERFERRPGVGVELFDGGLCRAVIIAAILATRTC